MPGVSSALARTADRRRYVDIDDQPRRGGALRHEHRRRAVGHHLGGGRRQHRRNWWKGCSASRSTCATRASRFAGQSCATCRSSPSAARLVLSDVADIRITDGPPMLRSENARLSGWVYVDIRAATSPARCRTCSAWPRRSSAAGYSVSWSGQFEFLERATAKLKVVVPFTLLIIFVLLYLTFKRFDEALLIMATLPFALVGGIWLLYLLNYNLSVAGRGGLHRAGRRVGRVRRDHVAVPEAAWPMFACAGHDRPILLEAIREGAVLRVRPKAMTVAVILAGLLPIMGAAAPGRKVMQRIAAPMVGG